MTVQERINLAEVEMARDKAEAQATALRARIAELERMCEMVEERAEAYEAENARLRAALEPTAENWRAIEALIPISEPQERGTSWRIGRVMEVVTAIRRRAGMENPVQTSGLKP